MPIKTRNQEANYSPIKFVAPSFMTHLSIPVKN
jgi:hypothetical protein